jgi:hypothetical protein
VPTISLLLGPCRRRDSLILIGDDSCFTVRARRLKKLGGGGWRAPRATTACPALPSASCMIFCPNS